MDLTTAEIVRAQQILAAARRGIPTDQETDELVKIAVKLRTPAPKPARRRRLLPPEGSLMTREEDQLQRESDERAAFNDVLDRQRYER